MKVRTDYVSNSSSSSFIVIVSNGKDETYDIQRDFLSYSEDWTFYEIPNSNGKHQFGWEWEDTHSFEGKLNFIGIQLLELFMMKVEGKKPEYSIPYTGDDFDRLYDMVQKVCREKFNVNIRLRDDLICMEMFESEDALWNFLRFEESHVRGGNDND